MQAAAVALLLAAVIQEMLDRVVVVRVLISIKTLVQEQLTQAVAVVAVLADVILET
jgi:hypothetical protein